MFGTKNNSAGCLEDLVRQVMQHLDSGTKNDSAGCLEDYSTGLVRQVVQHLDRLGKRFVDVHEQFSILGSNETKVSFAYRLLHEHKLLPDIIGDAKNEQLSHKYLEEGNELFKMKRNGKALESYTKSLAYAPEGSKSFALALANRSAVFFEMRCFEECLLDIDRALQHGYPEHLKPKLITRQDEAASKQSVRRIPHHTGLPNIPKEHANKKIQSASDLVEIRHSTARGRHVVAIKDIEIGDILAVESPFCKVLKCDFFSHCHECFKLCYSLIPCSECTQALYCNEDCKATAKNNHRYECSILKTARSMKIDDILLPMKISTQMMGSYKTPENLNVQASNNVYRSDRYDEIHGLMGNTENRRASETFAGSLIAAVIFHLIKTSTDFFGETQHERVFKELILHQLMVAINFHGISESIEDEEGFYADQDIGTGVYSFLSMFNHSCYPNLYRFFYGSTIVSRALTRIKAGEECCDDYGYHHSEMSRAERKQQLQRYYFFDCTCKACQEDWPLYRNLPGKHGVDPEVLRTLISYLQSRRQWPEQRKISQALISKKNGGLESDPFLLGIIQDCMMLKLGGSECSQKLLTKVAARIGVYEDPKPNRLFDDLQTVVKQRYNLLANVKRAL